MDLTDKEVKVKVLGVRHSPPSTTVEVDLMSLPNNGVREKVGTYELIFEDQSFSGPSDSALMAAIVSKLEAI